MYTKIVVLVIFCVYFVNCVPTIYKFNENKVLEPDLVPVSSTVIPIPVYKVSTGIQVAPKYKDEKIKKPEGPITLVTVHTKKKATESEVQQPKLKPNDISTIKQISQQQFNIDEHQ